MLGWLGKRLVCLQMVFYIEACESGSMMNHLPHDINGRWARSTGQGSQRGGGPTGAAWCADMGASRPAALTSSAPQGLLGNKESASLTVHFQSYLSPKPVGFGSAMGFGRVWVLLSDLGQVTYPLWSSGLLICKMGM